jgi:hypothetical protein
MGVVLGRDAGADVQELAQPGLVGQVAHGAAEELPVGADAGDDERVVGDRGLGGLPVGGEVVLAAQPVVVDAGRVGHVGVERGRFGPVPLRLPGRLGGHRGSAGSSVSETELMHHRWSVGTS